MTYHVEGNGWVGRSRATAITADVRAADAPSAVIATMKKHKLTRFRPSFAACRSASQGLANRQAVTMFHNCVITIGRDGEIRVKGGAV